MNVIEAARRFEGHGRVSNLPFRRGFRNRAVIGAGERIGDRVVDRVGVVDLEVALRVRNIGMAAESAAGWHIIVRLQRLLEIERVAPLIQVARL